MRNNARKSMDFRLRGNPHYLDRSRIPSVSGAARARPAQPRNAEVVFLTGSGLDFPLKRHDFPCMSPHPNPYHASTYRKRTGVLAGAIVANFSV